MGEAIIRPTTVVSVRGKTPADFAADPLFVYCGRAVPRRGWRASPFANPYRADRLRTGHPILVRMGMETPEELAADAVALFEAMLRPPAAYQLPDDDPRVDRRFVEMRRLLPTLRGKRLGCWCGAWQPGQPDIGCHAVVIARFADALSVEGEARP
jgi:hypothetical protein